MLILSVDIYKPSWFVAVMVVAVMVVAVMVIVCGRHGHGLWPSWSILWPSWFVAVIVEPVETKLCQ